MAAALEHAAHPVVVIAREQTAAVIEREGLEVDSVRLGSFAVRPRAVGRLDDPVDVLVVASKAPALEAALERIGAEPALVVPLLNGLDHMSVLRERFGTRAVAGSIRIEAERRAPGRIVHSSGFLQIEMASRDPGRGGQMQAFARVLEDAQIPAAVLASEAQVLWSKLVRLNALALTTSAADRPLGEIRSDPEWRVQLEAALGEGAAVGRAEGAEVSAEVALSELEAAHASLRSSMQRDIEAGREPELDAIAGSVLRAAARHGLACPTIESLAVRVAQRAGIPAPLV